MDDRRFEGKIVVVTGGSAGVGRATVRMFADEGAEVAILARGRQGLEGARRDVEQRGRRALAIQTDVADPDQVEAAAERIESELGPIDIWVNNAMTSVFCRVVDLEPDEVRRVTEVNYLGFVYGTMSALKRMIPRNSGTIVQVGSALAYRGIPLQAAYCGSKHAIQGFCDSLHSELLHDNIDIRLTSVNMPALNTPQFRWVRSKLPNKAQPVPPIFQPELAAEAILWAAEHGRREVNVGWPTSKAVVGNSFFPRLGDHYLATHGFDGQQTDEPEDPERPDNLFEPVEGDFGAHGEFDHRAKRESLQFWLNRNRSWVTPLALGAVAGVALAIGKGRR